MKKGLGLALVTAFALMSSAAPAQAATQRGASGCGYANYWQTADGTCISLDHMVNTAAAARKFKAEQVAAKRDETPLVFNLTLKDHPNIDYPVIAGSIKNESSSPVHLDDFNVRLTKNVTDGFGRKTGEDLIGTENIWANEVIEPGEALLVNETVMQFGEHAASTLNLEVTSIDMS